MYRVAATGTVLKLGTKFHHDKVLKGIDSLDAVGCFALTELGYGMHTRCDGSAYHPVSVAQLLVDS